MTLGHVTSVKADDGDSIVSASLRLDQVRLYDDIIINTINVK